MFKIEVTHDHQKVRFIPQNRPYLHLLGLSSPDGNIYDKSQDKYRQINKYVEVIDHLMRDFPIGKSIKVADMGSGKGYLTFALYDYLTNIKCLANCEVIGFEIRQDLVEKCNGYAAKSNFEKLHFQQKSISVGKPLISIGIINMIVSSEFSQEYLEY